jgi:anti-anti-sigma regulatory factor
MPNKPTPEDIADSVAFDTEPDDAFSLVLGDINANPLLQAPLLQGAGPAPQPAPHGATLQSPFLPCAATPNIFAPLAHPTPGQTQKHAPAPEGSTPPVQQSAVDEPVCTVVADTCVLDLSQIPPERLADTLARARTTTAPIIRLDLHAVQRLETRVLAVLLAFSRTLRRSGDKRLLLANCNPSLRLLFQTMRIQQTHGITLSVVE